MPLAGDEVDLRVVLFGGCQVGIANPGMRR